MQRASLIIIWVRRERKLGASEESWNEVSFDPKGEKNLLVQESHKNNDKNQNSLLG